MVWIKKYDYSQRRQYTTMTNIFFHWLHILFTFVHTRDRATNSDHTRDWALVRQNT